MEKDSDIIMANHKGDMKTVKNYDLLPLAFSKEDL